MTPAPSYLHRLRLEGAVLGVLGGLGTVALLVFAAGARDGILSTALQLVLLALLMAWLGPRELRRSVADSDARDDADVGSGEPTPLWHIALIVIVLTGLAALLGWDVSLRVTAGCVVVAGAQALLIAELLRREERRSGRTFYRTAGSRILRGTRLVHVPGRPTPSSRRASGPARAPTGHR